MQSSQTCLLVLVNLILSSCVHSDAIIPSVSLTVPGTRGSSQVKNAFKPVVANFALERWTALASPACLAMENHPIGSTQPCRLFSSFPQSSTPAGRSPETTPATLLRPRRVPGPDSA